MKLCMYVGYHDANNVSNFCGDPVTQLNLKKRFIVLLCPSEDMSPYCSAYDEWLIMKLCMYVGYHDANNVSNFGGDPNNIFFNFTILFCLSEDMSPYCSAYDEWLILKLCMYVGYHDANNVSNVSGDPVTQLNLKNVL